MLLLEVNKRVHDHDRAGLTLIQQKSLLLVLKATVEDAVHVGVDRESAAVTGAHTATPPNHHLVHDHPVPTPKRRRRISPPSVAAICASDLQTVTTLLLAVLPKEVLLMLAVAREQVALEVGLVGESCIIVVASEIGSVLRAQTTRL